MINAKLLAAPTLGIDCFEEAIFMYVMPFLANHIHD